MQEWQTALGFYQNPQTAHAVLQKLRSQGLKHSASIQLSHEGKLSLDVSRQDVNWLKPFVERVIRDETLVIVRIRSTEAPLALKLLRHVESGHPLSFLLRSPHFESRLENETLIKEPLTFEEMEASAYKLAGLLQQVSIRKTPDHPFLKRLAKSEEILTEIRHNVAEAEYVEQTITSAAEWLLDNSYVIQGNIEEVRRNLPKRYYDELPKGLEGVPRIYLIAKEIVQCTANRLNQEAIVAFLKSYQAQDPLTIGELWALPLMLRFVLIENLQCLAIDIDRRLCEGEQASFWGNRLLHVARREPERLSAFLEDLARTRTNPTSHFAEELIDHLYDEETILPLVRNWLEEKMGEPISDVIQREQKQQTAEQTAFSSAIVSLIALSQLSWRTIFETVSIVDALLKKDPTDTYSQMDFATRDQYRHAIEKIARLSKQSESAVAEGALQIAQMGKESIYKHVGYYLIDKGRPALEAKMGCRPSLLQRFRRALTRHSAATYLGSIGLLTLGMAAALFALLAHWHTPYPLLFALLALLPISELTIQVVNAILTQILPPLVLPKMFYENGLPEELKTLVVYPVMLTRPKDIEENLHQLEVAYLANSESALRFGLFFDFADAPQDHLPNDEHLLAFATKGFQDLEAKYGPDKFYFLLRNRVWSPSEGSWIGWERKRGKLESLNRYLMEGDDSLIVKFGSPEGLKRVRYVITLDADTQLPKDSAKQLVETLSHPLNAPHLSQEGKIVRGYTIIQPRVSTHFANARLSLFARLFSDVSSVDPYTQAVSDVYQDLTHEGSYHGKGIYDVQAFHKTLSKKFPEEHLLSHDLLEGCYARVAFANDISLLDQFPPDYKSWSQRQQRWMRGDWQIIDWLFDRSLSAINRWKIFDNLRRALLPVGIVALLITAWLISTIPFFWTAGVFLLLFTPPALLFLMRLGHFRAACKELGIGLLRTAINCSLLLHQAFLSLDALVRVLYRRLISHRHLLEWSTSKTATSTAYRRFMIRLCLISFCAVALFALIVLLHPGVHQIAMMSALPFCALWAVSPLLVAFLDRIYTLDPFQKISDEDRLFLRQVARRTWRYFDEFVGPNSNWLPPDNYQSALLVEVAERTSPTNIGLWTLSALAAHDFHYLTPDGVIDRFLATFQTLTKLETYEGHLLNWYDTRSLKPLYPRYVSTVDSGNFLACLWTLEQGLYQMVAAPLLPLSLLEGLRDTLALIESENRDPEYFEQLRPLKSALSANPKDLNELIQVVRTSLGFTQEFIAKQHPDVVPDLLRTMQRELEGWESLINRYFSFVEILHQFKTEEAQIVHLCDRVLKTPLSLQMLATGALHTPFERLLNILPKEDPVTKKLIEALHTAQWLAGEKMGLVKEILSFAKTIGERMNMKFLYNRERKLFSIGYHVDDRKLDSSYYDLLASEARLSSLVAIARGDVPVDHWWSLGRPYRLLYGRKVLLSWGGSMFEYLMPQLFTETYPDSLIGQACKNAVACQILYGEKRGIPWGISEAAFSEIDSRKIYQYRSFGVPGLGFKRGLEEDLVISPYSSALALAVEPIEATKNLKRMAFQKPKLLSDFGYYESIDFTRQHGPHGERGVTVYAFMAHHEGMSLLAFDNILHNNIMPKRFHLDPRIAGVESLLYERIPINPPIAKGSRKEVPISRLTPFSTEPIMGIVDTPHSATPKVNLLSNGEYSLMVTNAGGGYSRWRDFDISRWRADSTSDSWGNFCYIKDLASKAVWSTAYHPTWERGRKYSVSFKADKVEFRRRDEEIETLTEIFVSPEDDAEVRLLTLANLSREPHSLELTSYMELALSPHAADRAHPCFNKMFIQTEAHPELFGLLAFRRLRSPSEQPLFAIQVLAASESLQSLQYETDRNRFIGRGKSLRSPAALHENLSDSSGTVLDPIFSLRTRITLKPGERQQVAFITAIADNRDKAIGLMKKYGNLGASQRALEMAWTQTQLQLRHLRIHQEEAQLYQKLASRVLFPHAQLRPSYKRLRLNRRCQSNLWAYGISGDLPIVVASIADSHETISSNSC